MGRVMNEIFIEPAVVFAAGSQTVDKVPAKAGLFYLYGRFLI